MIDILSICGICVICAILSLTLKRYDPELSLLAVIATGAAAAMIIITGISPAIGELKSIIDMAQISDTYSQILLKSLGICMLCRFASDACDDAGEKALGNKITLAGKAAVLMLTLPMIRSVAQTALKLISGE